MKHTVDVFVNPRVNFLDLGAEVLGVDIDFSLVGGDQVVKFGVEDSDNL